MGGPRTWRNSSPVWSRSSGDWWTNQVRICGWEQIQQNLKRIDQRGLNSVFRVWADHLKTSRDRKREEELMAKLVEIVNDRNAIVEGLDEDRLRCVLLMITRFCSHELDRMSRIWILFSQLDLANVMWFSSGRDPPFCVAFVKIGALVSSVILLTNRQNKPLENVTPSVSVKLFASEWRANLRNVSLPLVLADSSAVCVNTVNVPTAVNHFSVCSQGGRGGRGAKQDDEDFQWVSPPPPQAVWPSRRSAH